MIISRGRRYIFVHIPKTGGTSLALALEGRAMADDVLVGDTPKARRRRKRLKGIETQGRLWKHSTLAEAEGLITRAEMADFFTFTLVRNPWDRMVSYYHWLQAQDFDHPAVALSKSLPFSLFLHHDVTEQAFRAAPYGQYMTDGAGQEHCRLFIRLEHLAEDAGPLWQHLGFDLDVPRVNASGRNRDWRPYYTDDDAAWLGELCAEDISRFGYGFDDVLASSDR
ncbi:sulfotransferase family 2 domain-containing protein [Salibaculum griseiflavum]|uniref:Type II secretory pathway, pullulanase PulA n=1 Tax=Salibaculum griseiflavum TaxID=1914409 RepID=A0A2V1P126_9RHOB|nr:sulfotransferase family 2 domain-containing protein [Salibaculum griseiflavum]PWG16231.1 Type II secretory pathway, pullulanase PulA [Salibaculum griseiflavum]